MPNNSIAGSLGGTFDPAQLVCTLTPSALGAQAQVISGFAEDIADIERTSDQAGTVSGADGMVAKFFTNDRRGKVNLHLLQVSPSNAVLESLATADENGGAGIFALSIKDTLGNDVINSQNSWILKRPRVEYKKGIAFRVWPIECANLKLSILGEGTLP